ncbi:MAG: hypothetical protein ACLGI9_01970, partial [Thermoanaerobaculia bacterium]
MHPRQGCVSLTAVETPRDRNGEPARPWQVLILSAPTEAALEVATAGLAELLRGHPDIDLGDVAWTLQT